MGLGYQVAAVMTGALCLFPDGNTCDIVGFFRGTGRSALSYCARHGYTVEQGNCSQGGVAACRFPDGTLCSDGDFTTGVCGPCVPGRDTGCAGVWVSTDKSLYTNAEAITLTLHNDTAATVFVPPCAGQGVERLLPNGTWEPLSVGNMCNLSSGPWQTVVTMTTREEPVAVASTLQNGMHRVYKTVGYGCDTSVSAAEADCERVESVYADPFGHVLK
jgi:putative hemolysin